MVTGFQVIAHPTYFDQLGKLYANYITDFQTSAIVEVEQNGEFLVSVFPVLGETGIVKSSVEYGCERFAHNNKYRLVAIVCMCYFWDRISLYTFSCRQ